MECASQRVAEIYYDGGLNKAISVLADCAEKNCLRDGMLYYFSFGGFGDWVTDIGIYGLFFHSLSLSLNYWSSFGAANFLGDLGALIFGDNFVS